MSDGSSQGPTACPTHPDYKIEVVALPVSSTSSSLGEEEIDLNAIGKDLARFQTDVTVRDALSRGVQPARLLSSTENEIAILQKASVSDYLCPEILISAAALHDRLQRADKALRSAQEVIKGFQDHLGDVSVQMRQLHGKCSLVKSKLSNREALLEHLNAFLGRVAVSTELRKTLTKGTVNEDFLQQLKALNKKIEFLRSPEGITGRTRAARSVAPQLEELRSLAVKHILHYLTTHIQSLRKSTVQVQRVQRDKLQRYNFFMTFLREHAPGAAAEVEDLYIANMRRMFQQLIRQYHDDLMRHVGEMATKNDLIVVDESARRGIFSGRVKVQRRNNAFALNERHRNLSQLEQEVGWLEVRDVKIRAKKAGRSQVLMVETMFQSVLERLAKACTFEFLFLEHFMGSARQLAVFKQVMSACFTANLAQMTDALSNTYDIIGLLLLLHSLRLMRDTTHQQLPELAACLEVMYFAKLAKIIIKRFEYVIAENSSAMQNCNPRQSGAITLHAHITSLRFGQLVCSIYSVQSWWPTTEETKIIGTALDNLCGNMRTLLGRLSETHSRRRDRMVFLVNNIDQILTLFAEGRVRMPWVNQMQELMEKQVLAYVEDLLQEKFRDLIAFVQTLEQWEKQARLARGTGPRLRTVTQPNVKAMGSIATSFARSYKATIKGYDKTVIQSFQNAKLAITVAKRLFKRLLRLYPKFHNAVKTRFPDNSHNRPAWLVQMVGTGAVMVEVKRYQRLL